MSERITVPVIEGYLEGFDTISLKETSSIRLMDRYDTKYTFNFSQLEGILRDCKSDYQITTEKGLLLFPYETWYYDSPDKALYTSHHNGKAHRYKFRIRSYTGFDLIFAEVKEKFKGKTFKQRIPFGGFSSIEDCLAQEETPSKIDGLITGCTPYSFFDFEVAMRVDFHRMTLVHTNREERITIDTLLTYTEGDRVVELPHLVIAEIKHQGPVPHLGFSQILKSSGIHAGSFSKYCIGTAKLHPELKYNNFKTHLMKIERLAQ